jgi:hypothetical protein
MGLGLAGLIYAVKGLDAFLPAAGMPSTPSTNLNNLVPFLAGVPDIPATVIGAVSMLAIPILVVVGVTRRQSWRAVAGLAMLTLVAAIGWSFTPTADLDPVALALLIPYFVVAAVAIKAWAARSAWSWFVAALAYKAFGGLREAVYGPEWQARVAGVFTVLAATALIALIWERTRPRSSSPGASHPAPPAEALPG